MTATGFRIILVGGGPVGMVAAHVFAAAGIDFVLLEQRANIVLPQGAGIVLFPHTQRVFEQLGLMGPIREIAYRFRENRIVDSWGRHFLTTYTSKWAEEEYAISTAFVVSSLSAFGLASSSQLPATGTIYSLAETDELTIETAMAQGGSSCTDQSFYACYTIPSRIWSSFACTPAKRWRISR
jgi:flavin-dependent dehydrogenase